MSGEANDNEGTFGMSTTTAWTSSCPIDGTQRVDKKVASLMAWAVLKGTLLGRIIDEKEAVHTRQVKSSASFMASLEQWEAPPSSLNNVGNGAFVPAIALGAKER